MGLIKAALGSSGGVLADQWKEFIYCEAIPETVLAVKGQKRTSGRSSNTKGNDNIITSGSIIAVADGQCMLIVEQGKVVEVCAEPGEFVYDASTEPSIFSGGLNGENIRNVLSTVGKRFTFGGEAPKDQRVYYFNTKELIGNKYGTPSPIPFRVVDERAGIDIDVSVRCFGEYSYRITNPLLFYTNICGNVETAYDRATIDGQLKSEFLTALQPAFAKVSAMGIRYSAVLAHTKELADAMKEVLSGEWRDHRGIEVEKIGMSSIKATEEDEQMLKEMQRNAAFMDPTRAAAHLVGAQASAMQTAAANEGGAMTGFLGMGMAQGVGGMNAQGLFQMGQQMSQQDTNYMADGPGIVNESAQPGEDGWKCACGAGATGKFCPECGAKKPEPKSGGDTWDCACGNRSITGKFCPECGAKKPESAFDSWTCTCGTVNKGKFCAECGGKKPAGIPQYRCDKCGWEPEAPTKAPKFCPECGDPFDDGDRKG